MKFKKEEKAKNLHQEYSAKQVSEKDIETANKKSKFLGEQKDNFMLLLEMFSQTIKGTYKMSKTDSAIIIGAIVYVISPIDAIPDIIPFLGWVDDIGVVAFAMSKLSDEIIKFKAFQNKTQKQIR